MSRRIDEIQLVILPVPRRVGHADRVQLDRDAALALEVERVEHLSLHFALLQHPRGLDQPVGEGRFSVVDVRDDAEVANVLELQMGSRIFLREVRGREPRNITVNPRAPGGEKKKEGRSSGPLFHAFRSQSSVTRRWRS